MWPPPIPRPYRSTRCVHREKSKSEADGEETCLGQGVEAVLRMRDGELQADGHAKHSGGNEELGGVKEDAPCGAALECVLIGCDIVLELRAGVNLHQ